ncbi:hypothetical protein N7478_000495, partial [Penicillium angulare]|uniref:uncharacterized protein n=1 Tax=Penicillium angulare TaxID=116970 RepID=UPI0025424A7C
IIHRSNTMKREYLPLDSLPAWLKLNGIVTKDVAVQKVGSDESDIDKGNAIVATATRSNDCPVAPPQVLLQIPRDLVLSLETVQDYSKSDADLREVLQAAGEFGRTMRGSVLIFLLVQITHNNLQGSRKIGVSSPWSEYIKFLPPTFSLPTLWSEEEQELLRGTSLGTAVEAKMNSLQKEFDFLRQATENISWCQERWWNESSGDLSFEDWVYVDAAYRSRMLDLPGSGHSMVPCIDMVNHVAGSATKALYDADSEGNAILQLHRDKTLEAGEEVTISYGDRKSASEMIFSYGFLDDDMFGTSQVMLDIEFPEDDPLGVAKKIICKDTPGIRLSASQDPYKPSLVSSTGFGDITWDSPLMWWSSVNEEDGLEIGVAQTNDGSRELEAKWRGEKVQSPAQLAEILASDPLVEVFQLRAVVLVLERLETQLSLLHQADQILENFRERPELLIRAFRPEIFFLVCRLRKLEADLLQRAVEDLLQQKIELMKSETVATFLTSQSQSEEAEDFS